ncbi:MAG: hypothetical protein IJ650_01890 [Paludibacteraceae bacterium]|nr:hypothetical protein [Paludibacteraceae bacterium]
MKNIIKINALVCIIISIVPLNNSKAGNKICDNFSDYEWIMWFADSLDTNTELTEMRNEYLFCKLESDDSESFINFLYSAINKKNKRKIRKELAMPLNDGVDLNRCISNISKSKINRRFKKWLICQLEQQGRLTAHKQVDHNYKRIQSSYKGDN